MTTKIKTLFGIFMILIGVCFFLPLIIYNVAAIYALIISLAGMFLIVAGSVMLDIARNEKFKQKYGEELWHPKLWKKAAIWILITVAVGFVIFVIVSFFLVK